MEKTEYILKLPDLGLVLEKLQSIENYLSQNQTSSITERQSFLTRQEVAELCGNVSLTTLHNWRQKGVLVPTKKAGRKPLYDREDVYKFLNSNGL